MLYNIFDHESIQEYTFIIYPVINSITTSF